MIAEAIGWGWTIALVVGLIACWMGIRANRKAYRHGWDAGYQKGYTAGVRNMAATFKLSEDIATTFGKQTLDDAVNVLAIAMGGHGYEDPADGQLG